MRSFFMRTTENQTILSVASDQDLIQQFSKHRHLKGSIFLINRYFIIQERFYNLIHGINT